MKIRLSNVNVVLSVSRLKFQVFHFENASWLHQLTFHVVQTSNKLKNCTIMRCTDSSIIGVLICLAIQAAPCHLLWTAAEN